MIELDDISKIIGLILAFAGAIALIVGIMSFFGAEQNPSLVAGGAVSLAIGIAIHKAFG
ncbi:MAG: hypothetical protein ACW9W4_06345 [Candidatus Nitrosopumilus sp. bin_7KS]